ncbi:MAG: glycosyl transferase family 2 [Schwartzia succinivorans]|nr:glycosyl transferase family 2 [Schwartzia succinivorans]
MGSVEMTDASKIAFITCVNDEEKYEECLLYLRRLRLPGELTAEYIPMRGAASMAAGYNAAMRSSDARLKVYLHQDVLVVNKDFVRDIQEIFADGSIGMIGVVGCRSLPASGIWWDGMRCYGRVLHACEPESVVDSEMQEPEGLYVEVEAADGLLLATQYDIPWREELFGGWHFYDTSQCMEFARRGKKVVVPNQTADFWCIHCPVEKPLAPEYREWQKVFLQEYGAELSPEI